MAQYTPRAVLRFHNLAQARRGNELAEFANATRSAYHAKKNQFKKFIKELTSDG